MVEDEPFLLTDTAAIFNGAGMAAFEARDADEAVTIVSKRDDIGVVITDPTMPLGRMDSRALVHTLAMRWPDIGVLVLSGTVTPKPGALPSGVRFVSKPCRGRDLVSAAFAIVSH